MNESLPKVAHHISELLFRYDCIIVPGLGGFVTNYEPARIHPINHTFSPPSKSILFNSSLTKDDGLLLHTMSSAENISYEEAKSNLSEFVKACLLKLENGEKLNFKHVGILKRSIEGNLLFEPDTSVNYLEESFGLPSFISPPIIRQSTSKRLEKKFIDRKPVPEKENNRKKILVASLLLIPILFFTGWFTFNSGVFNNNSQHSSMLPTQSDGDISLDVSSAKPENTEKPNVTPIKDLNFEDATDEISSEETPVKENPETRESAIKKPTYYIIGGAFSVPENADKLITRLQQKGYRAEAAGQSPSGLFMVCYFKTEDRPEALANLEMIRKDDNPSAYSC
ncbi:MAG: SPOR domain-containing protein [Bacteroidales bacterium]